MKPTVPCSPEPRLGHPSVELSKFERLEHLSVDAFITG